MFHLLFPSFSFASSHQCKVKWFMVLCLGLIAFPVHSFTKTNVSQKQKRIQEIFLKCRGIQGFCIKLSTENENSQQGRDKMLN